MPTANYLNPTSINPSFPQQPGGALSGYLGYQDRQHFQDVIGLQKLMQAMEVMKQEEELTQGRSARTAERGASEAKNLLAQVMANQQRGSQPYLDASLAGQIGTNQSLAAKGFVDQATTGDKVMESRLGAQGSGIEFLNRAIPRIKAATTTPLQAQVYLETLQQMPKEVRGIFPQEYGPQSIPMLEALQKQLVNSPRHAGDMERANAEIAGREKVANIQGRTARDVADTRGIAQYESALARSGIGKEQLTQARNIVGKLLEKQMKGEELTDAEKRTFTIAQQIEMQFRAAAGGFDMNQGRAQVVAGGTMDPNAPRPLPTPVPAIGAPVDLTDQQAQAELGSTYDARYKYRRKPGGGHQRTPK